MTWYAAGSDRQDNGTLIALENLKQPSPTQNSGTKKQKINLNVLIQIIGP
jgi:hypothetical protein